MRKSSIYLALLSLTSVLPLSGCVGGSISQQVARSVLMQAADKVTWEAMESQRRQDEFRARNVVLRDTIPDAYWAAMLTSGFDQAPAATDTENASQPEIAVTRLVPVEIWGFIVGQEKQLMLERMRMRGADTLPSASEWDRWQLATGRIAGQADAQLYVLVPPDFGRLNSGEQAIVEIASAGGAHVVRHRAE